MLSVFRTGDEHGSESNTGVFVGRVEFEQISLTGGCLLQSESETGSGRKLERKSIVCLKLCSSGMQANEGTKLSIVGKRRFSSVDNDLFSLLSRLMGVCNIKGPVSIKRKSCHRNQRYLTKP